MRRPRGGAAGLATTDKTEVTRLLGVKPRLLGDAGPATEVGEETA